MKIKLKQGVVPFHYSKFGKKWSLFDGADIPEKVWKNLRHKITRIKVGKDGE